MKRPAQTEVFTTRKGLAPQSRLLWALAFLSLLGATGCGDEVSVPIADMDAAPEIQAPAAADADDPRESSASEDTPNTPRPATTDPADTPTPLPETPAESEVRPPRKIAEDMAKVLGEAFESLKRAAEDGDAEVLAVAPSIAKTMNAQLEPLIKERDGLEAKARLAVTAAFKSVFPKLVRPVFRELQPLLEDASAERADVIEAAQQILGRGQELMR